MNTNVATSTTLGYDNNVPCLEVRRCKHCSQLQPTTEFRRVRTGQERRHTVCRECRKRLRREETRLRREKRTHRYAQCVNRLAAEEKFNAITQVTAQMISHFRGLDGFVQTWKAAVDTAAQNGKTRVVCNSLLAIANLVIARSSLQAGVDPLAQFGDEELHRQFERVAMRVVMQHPELAVRAGRQLGWAITPLNDDPDRRSCET